MENHIITFYTMLTKYTRLFITIVLISFLSKCKPPSSDLYSFVHDFDEKNYHLCPIRGALAMESHWIKNLWVLAPEDHSMRAVVHTLFHLLDSGELNTTNYEPFVHFTHKTIAEILHALNKKSIDKQNTDGTFTILDSLRKSFRGNKNPKRLNQFIHSIIRAQKEVDDGHYPHHIIEQLLQAFWHQKSQKMRAIRNLKTLLTLPAGTSAPIPQTCRITPWREEEYQEFASWASTTNENEHIPYDFENDFEFLLFAVSRQNEHYDNAPPKLIYVYSDMPYAHDIADCCESTLRYFCYLLLYSKEKKLLDLSRLSVNIQKSMKKQFKDYFSAVEISSSQTVNDQKSRISWYTIISNIDNVCYRRKANTGEQFEIHPSCQNFLSVLYHIFGYTQKHTSIDENILSKCQKFCKVISSNSAFDLTISNISYQSDTNASLTFNLVSSIIDTKNKKDVLIFTIHIQPEHSWITIDNEEEQFLKYVIDSEGSRKKLNRMLLAEKLLEKYTNSKSQKVRDLLHLFAAHLPVAELPIESSFDTLLLAHPTESDKQKYRLFLRLSDHRTIDDSLFSHSIFRLLKTFFDPYYVQRSLTTIIHKNNLLTNKHIADSICSYAYNLPEWEKYQVFLALIQEKAWRYKPFCSFLLDALHELPDFEEEYNLCIDAKLVALINFLTHQAYKNSLLEREFFKTIKSLNTRRLLNLHKRSLLSPLSDFNDPLSNSMKDRLHKLCSA